MKKINPSYLLKGFVALGTIGTVAVVTHAANFTNTDTTSATPVTIIGGPINGAGSGVGTISGGGGSNYGLCSHGSDTYIFLGSPQYFTITPSIAACGSLSFTLLGGGGGGSGGNGSCYGYDAITGGNPGAGGGVVSGIISVSSLTNNTLTIIVGGGGEGSAANYCWSGSGGPGGGSFVCEGAQGAQCSQSTVLLAAGGGGGANSWSGGGSWSCSPIVQNCDGTVGGADNGGEGGSNYANGNPGGNGQVIISW